MNYVHRSKFLMHDEANACVPGDVVRIGAFRPLSKRKSHIITEIVRPALVVGGGRQVGLRHEIHPNEKFRSPGPAQLANIAEFKEKSQIGLTEGLKEILKD